MTEPTGPGEGAEADTLIYNPATERTATALLQLLASVAETLGTEENRLVQQAGALAEHGTVGMYAHLPFVGAMEYRDVVVGWLKAGETKATTVSFGSIDEAGQQFEATWRKLDEDA
jgi:hypothetical protein